MSTHARRQSLFPLGIQHLHKQGVFWQVAKLMTTIEVVFAAIANAAYFGQQAEQVAELVVYP